MRAGGGGGGGGYQRINQPTKNRRDLSLPKPDPVWATSHPEIQQNTTKKKKGEISPGVQTREMRKQKSKRKGAAGKFEKEGLKKYR